MPAERAEQLGRLRTRLNLAKRRHMFVGRGCACGMPGGHIDPSAIDQMLIEYLNSKYQSSGYASLAALFDDDDSATAGDALSRLIGDVIELRRVLAVSDQDTLCADLEKMIGSLEELGMPNSFRAESV